jgi:hypothetical protein
MVMHSGNEWLKNVDAIIFYYLQQINIDSNHFWTY